MILYGSQTSPFVRRIRLLLDENLYQFKKLDIFKPEERKQLLQLSPILKIPVLEIDGQIIWDSRVMFNELVRRGYHANLTLHEENLLTAINDISDSLIQILLAKRSHIEFPKGSHLDISHGERIHNVLAYLEKQLDAGDFSKWNFPSMCLYILIDWILFRELTPLNSFPKLLQFHKANGTQPRVALSDPRNS